MLKSSLAVLLLSGVMSAQCRYTKSYDASLDAAWTAPKSKQVTLMPDFLRIDNKAINISLRDGSKMHGFDGVSNGAAPFVVIISDRLTEQERKETLYHELSHIAARLSGHIFNPCKKFDEDDSIELFTPVMVRILEQNPQLVQYLTR